MSALELHGIRVFTPSNSVVIVYSAQRSILKAEIHFVTMLYSSFYSVFRHQTKCCSLLLIRKTPHHSYFRAEYYYKFVFKAINSENRLV